MPVHRFFFSRGSSPKINRNAPWVFCRTWSTYTCDLLSPLASAPPNPRAFLLIFNLIFTRSPPKSLLGHMRPTHVRLPKTWSDKTYTPLVPYLEYFSEKTNFAGSFICSILYGTLLYLHYPWESTQSIVPRIIIALFFRCINGLFFAIFVSMTPIMLSTCYAQNREFPGVDGKNPGPFGHLMNVL